MSVLIAHRSVRSLAVVGVLAALVGTGPVSAQGPVVTIDPAGPLPAGTSTITISGTGFDPAAADGNGIYVVFGPVTPAPGYYMDAGLYSAFKWVSPGGPESAATAPLGTDGTFSTTLDVSSISSGSSGEVDCTTDACAIITFGAHGSTDRSQDTCTVLLFDGAATTASGDPTASPAASPSVAPEPTTAAAAAVSPGPSSAPGDDPCAVMLAGS